jgi:GDPmannose 4,6-dehydratase
VAHAAAACAGRLRDRNRRQHGDPRHVPIAFSHVGLDWERHVTVDTSLYRPAEVDMLRGDAAKAQERLDWRPSIDLPQLMGMMVDADLQRLG